MGMETVIVFTIFLCSSLALQEDARDQTKTAEPILKILVTHPEVPQEALDALKPCELILCHSVPANRSEILDKIRGVDGVLWASNDALNAEVLDAAGPQLKSISTMSAGIDYVDVEELRKRNIPLGHTPTVLNNAVADLSVGLMLAAARRFHEGRQKILSSTWENYHVDWMLGQDISGSVVGFFGFGGIGQAIARRLKGFNIDHILYTTRHEIPKILEREYAASKVPFDQLLAKSDILFIAAPLTRETHGVFNETAFAKMKKTAVLVNTARGPIVKQNDLYNALKSGQIFAAGIDVMTPEPLPANEQLLSLSNLIVTPHIGSATKKARLNMALIAAHNVKKGLAGEHMYSPAY